MPYFRFKIAIIGPAEAGKSAIVERFVNNKFLISPKVLPLDIISKDFEYEEGEKVFLSLWDICGHKRFEYLRSVFYKGAAGILLVFDMTNVNSYHDLNIWLNESKLFAGNAPIILVGNKSDLSSEINVNKETFDKYISDNNLIFIQTSAKSGHNINQAFKILIQKIIKAAIDRRTTELLSSFDRYYNAKLYKKAIEVYMKIEEFNKQIFSDWIKIGNAYFYRKSYGKAIHIYEKEVTLNPSNKIVLKNLGICYEKEKNYEFAAENYEKLVKLFPNDEESWVNLGKIYLNKKDYSNAIKCYRKVLNLNPNHKKISKKLHKLEKKVKIEIKREKGSILHSIKSRKLPSKKITQMKKQLSYNRREENKLFVGCGGNWEVNIFKFKIKLRNNSESVITDINITIDKYPSMLKILDERIKTTSTLQPNGAIWTPEFKFFAGDECVSGSIFSSVKFFDHKGKPYYVNVREFRFSYICPLLEAKKIEGFEYYEKKKEMSSQETTLEIEKSIEIPVLIKEIRTSIEDMNFAILDLKNDPNEIVGFAKDIYKHDELALEAKVINSEGRIELYLKALCEQNNKCSALLFKLFQEMNKIGLSIEKTNIMQKLDLFIDKPDDLYRYLKRVINSDWSDEEIDKWASVIREILDDWRRFKPTKWQKAGKILVKFIGGFIGTEFTELLSDGVRSLFYWILDTYQRKT